MRIALIHNRVPENAGPEDLDVLVQVRAVSRALESLGHETSVIEGSLDLSGLKGRILAVRPDLAFNLVEGLEGHGRLIHLIPCLLDALRVPYTGAPSDGMYLTSHKILAKERMRSAGVATPDWITSRGVGGRSTPFRGRFIVKSVWEHASFGMSGDAVVDCDGAHELVGILAKKEKETGREFFAEGFVEGREFNVSVIAGPEGPQVLAPAEIDFSSFPAGKARIVDYSAKWEEGSFECENTVRSFDFPESDAVLLEKLARLSLECYRLFGLKGYARVDFRVDAGGKPWVLEVNANPCISPDAGFAAALERSGMLYEEALGRILDDAVRPGLDRGAGALPPREPFFERFTIREELTIGDVGRIEALVAETGFFSAEEVGVAGELARARLAHGAGSGYHFILIEDKDLLAGYACFGPVPCTISGHDLYWIAVKPALQGMKLGREILERVEKVVVSMGGARLYADTSGKPGYAPTRDFYERVGFQRECLQEDFYAPGDPRILYCKKLS